MTWNRDLRFGKSYVHVSGGTQGGRSQNHRDPSITGNHSRSRIWGFGACFASRGSAGMASVQLGSDCPGSWLRYNTLLKASLNTDVTSGVITQLADNGVQEMAVERSGHSKKCMGKDQACCNWPELQSETYDSSRTLDFLATGYLQKVFSCSVRTVSVGGGP